MKQIAPLYALERELREIDAPPEKRAAERNEKPRPLADAFFKELERKAKDSENPPLNKLRNAIDYALERKDTLMHWLDNPAVPMDNNHVERTIRPLTIGRKNCLFIGAPEAGDARPSSIRWWRSANVWE
ncbi:MAG: transposase [Akkermansia sp.]|nr:transposase [Akkermansia sp.]